MLKKRKLTNYIFFNVSFQINSERGGTFSLFIVIVTSAAQEEKRRRRWCIFLSSDSEEEERKVTLAIWLRNTPKASWKAARWGMQTPAPHSGRKEKLSSSRLASFGFFYAAKISGISDPSDVTVPELHRCVVAVLLRKLLIHVDVY